MTLDTFLDPIFRFSDTDLKTLDSFSVSTNNTVLTNRTRRLEAAIGSSTAVVSQMNDVCLKKSLNCYLVHFPICHSKKQRSGLGANDVKCSGSGW